MGFVSKLFGSKKKSPAHSGASASSSDMSLSRSGSDGEVLTEEQALELRAQAWLKEKLEANGEVYVKRPLTADENFEFGDYLEESAAEHGRRAAEHGKTRLDIAARIAENDARIEQLLDRVDESRLDRIKAQKTAAKAQLH
jgi:hypothetical protein